VPRFRYARDDDDDDHHHHRLSPFTAYVSIQRDELNCSGV